MRISVIIPNRDGEPLLAECLDSLARQSRPADEVIVVDNGSADGSRELAAAHSLGPRLIELPGNGGFAAAVNRGIESAGAEVIALLNNDAVADPRWIEAGLEAFQRYPLVFMFASKMLDKERPEIIDSAGDLYPPDGRPRSRGRGEAAREFDTPVEVLYPCAGAAFYRRSLFDEVGLFEESFFAYLEDVDLGLRARGRGHVCLYIPEAVVHHAGAMTELGDRGGRKRVDSSGRVRLISRNRVRLLGRHWPAKCLAARGPWLAAGLARSAAYHLAGPGDGRAFIEGLRQGVALWSEDRDFRRRYYENADFGAAAALIRAGELPWPS